VRAVREEEVKLWGGVEFAKQVGFKPGVKERELWMGNVATLYSKGCQYSIIHFIKFVSELTQ